MNGLFRPEWSTLKKLMFLQSASGGGYATISGNPVSFTAKAAPLRKLQVAFSPVQSLNGYDAPWPAGGGANQWDEEWELGTISPSTGENTPSDQYCRTKNYIPVDANRVYYIHSGVSPLYARRYDENKTFLGYAQLTVNVTFQPPSGTAYIRFVWDGTTYGNNISWNYPSSVTTYSPYSNLCPISGWSSLTVEQRGKNLSLVDASHIDKPSWYPYTWAGSSVSGANGLTVTRSNSQGGCGGFFISGLRQGKYTLSTDVDGSTAGNYRVYVYYSTDGSDINQLPNNALTVAGSRGSCVIDIPADTYQVAIRMCASEFATGFTETKFNEILLELGSTATDYQPYNGRSISITLGQTVYSGTLDVLTGVVTVTHEIVDLGSLTWTFRNTCGLGNTGDVFYSSLITDAVSTNADVTIMCSMYMPVTADWLYAHNTTDCIIALPASTRLYIRDFSTQDADVFKTKVTGQTVHYHLATPFTIQLTPQEVESLAGDNVLFSDANGDLTVEYRSN